MALFAGGTGMPGVVGPLSQATNAETPMAVATADTSGIRKMPHELSDDDNERIFREF